MSLINYYECTECGKIPCTLTDHGGLCSYFPNRCPWEKGGGAPRWRRVEIREVSDDVD